MKCGVRSLRLTQNLTWLPNAQRINFVGKRTRLLPLSCWGEIGCQEGSRIGSIRTKFRSITIRLSAEVIRLKISTFSRYPFIFSDFSATVFEGDSSCSFRVKRMSSNDNLYLVKTLRRSFIVNPVMDASETFEGKGFVVYAEDCCDVIDEREEAIALLISGWVQCVAISLSAYQ